MIKLDNRKARFFTVSKKSFVCIVASALFLSCLYFRDTSPKEEQTEFPAIQQEELLLPSTSDATEMKFVLIWTSNSTYPFKLLKTGQQAFLEAGCDVNDCYVTSDRKLLDDYTNFDAVLFHGPELSFSWFGPSRRSPKQKYVFASVESAANYPLCDARMDRFFNWTWTYRLDSDEVWSPVTVRDLTGRRVGPSTHMIWTERMQPINEDLKRVFTKRKKAAAWFVSNCNSESRREDYVEQLTRALRDYGLSVDIYGRCGPRICPRANETSQDCEDMLRRDYYFYLAFENSFSDDYVTEKVLHGYTNFVVPVVFGSANYTRFLPPNSYLNALNVDPKSLAESMHRAISSPELYHEFFRWTNHYRVEASEMRPDSHPFCRFCAALHDESRVREVTVRDGFRRWWNGQLASTRNLCALVDLMLT